MQLAIARAGIGPSDIQHLNAHANSTQLGDRGEIEAIKAVFGTGGGIAISGTNSATGHLLGAAGGLEAIFTILALRDQIAPPTLNLSDPVPAVHPLDLVVGSGRGMTIDYAILNGFGFGGVNASIVFHPWTEDEG